jgi:hypothetical protein
MSGWADVAIEGSRQLKYLDVKGLGIKHADGTEIETLPFMTLSGDEYFILRRHEKFSEMKEKMGPKFTKDVENQLHGLLACWMRLFKADEKLSHQKFFSLPLELQLKLVRAMDAALGVDKLGGGEAPNREES